MRRRTHLQRELTRRDLFRRAACAAVSTVAIASTVRDLRLINAAAADALPSGTPDYKAMVCIFLFGGNDSNNMLMQYEDNPAAGAVTGYQGYANLRGASLAIPKANLIPINPTVSDGHQYALHPSMPEVANLFNAPASRLALVCNVGPLLYPILAASDYTNKKVSVPPQLFSHNDQVIQWQTSIPDRDSPTGWCGRVADLMNTLNTNSTVSMSISVSGINTLEVGNIVNEYTVGTSGPQGLTGGTGSESFNLNQKLQDLNNLSLTPAAPTTPQNNLYEVSYASTIKRGIDNFAATNGAITPTVDPTTGTKSYWTTPFPATTLGRQLKMVARLIAGRKILNHARQIFFVSVGGYDLHTSQVGTTTFTGAHAGLLTELSQCINAFQAAMDQLRADPNTAIQMGATDGVVGFTASDFGRTCQGNGTTGSDHGWGNHQIVFGDGVAGGRLYGAFPVYQLKGPDDAVPQGSAGYGRWIPKISVDEYSATLAKWFGVTPTALNTVFPNLPHFANYVNTDLGFMTPPPPPPGPSLPIASAEVTAPVSGSKPTPVKSKPTPVRHPAARR